jgi:hypothetical protein
MRENKKYIQYFSVEIYWKAAAWKTEKEMEDNIKMYPGK